MSDIFGQTKTLRASERAELEKLSTKRTDPKSLIDVELARRVARLAHATQKQIAFLIERNGRIFQTVLGSKDRLYLPDLGRQRIDPTRLRRLRLVVFVPDCADRLSEQLADTATLHLAPQRKKSGSTSRTVLAMDFPDDFLVDLEKLRLDGICLVAVDDDGDPGPISFAYLKPREGGQRGKELKRDTRNIARYFGNDLRDISINFAEFADDLEAQIERKADARLDTGKDRAVLIGAYTNSSHDSIASMEELTELARTAGLQISDVIIQRRHSLDPRTVIGAGKVEQVTLRCLDLGVDILVFDRELGPSQLRSITKITDLRVIDRSMLILDIFAQRAKSSEGRLQVELAQLKYSLPRLTDKDTGLSRLTGGIGGRGPGETKLEISRRRARDRIADLERRIDKIASQRGVRRHLRQERGVPVVAIVGYTNSGKSTLLNALTRADVLVENKLFATLDPSSRRMRFPNDREVIFVDTVGFIRELPDELVNAFRATLEEVGEADLLVHLVDASNPDLRKQVDVVNGTLESLGFGSKPKVLVLNKIDLISDFEVQALQNALGAMSVSATRRVGFQDLVHRIQEELRDSFRGVDPGGFIYQPR